MSSKADTASSSSRGPVVRTRVATRTPEVHVSFPEATSSPSFVARCGSKVSGWISDMSDGTFAAVMVGVTLGLLLTLFTVIGFQERAALQERIGEIRTKNAEQQGQLNYLLKEVRELRAARRAAGGSATNADSPHVAGPSTSWLDSPDVAPPPSRTTSVVPVPTGSDTGGPALVAGARGSARLMQGDPGGPK